VGVVVAVERHPVAAVLAQWSNFGPEYQLLVKHTLLQRQQRQRCPATCLNLVTLLLLAAVQGHPVAHTSALLVVSLACLVSTVVQAAVAGA